MAMAPTRNATALAEWRAEWAACAIDPFYFLDRYVHVYDATRREWVPFHLWPAQVQALDLLERRQLLVVLKARQLGWSWLAVGYVLWDLLFHPGTTAILFSKRDDEAVELLDVRLKGMVERLPKWMRPGGQWANHRWRLANGSRALAFPTTGGRSYTATIAVVDEADFVPDLGQLLNAVKPTIDAGGKLVLLSTADKARPDSEFKRIYAAACEGRNSYQPIFHGWQARPDRTPAWYEEQRADIQARTGALDDLYQEYPATDVEALSPRSLDKRLPADWLLACYRPMPLAPLLRGCPTVPGLRLYVPPWHGGRYVVGGDPAEGNPTSDPSAACVLDADTGEEVASFAGRIEPTVFAHHLAQLARWYNRACLMVERNNHGHTVLAWLRDNATDLRRLLGHDGKEGWLSSHKGKVLLYDACADALGSGEVVLHTRSTYLQLASVEGSTLLAPEGQHDDESDAFALACAGVTRLPSTTFAPVAGGTPPRPAPVPGPVSGRPTLPPLG